MSSLRVSPAASLRGATGVPGDKSIGHRALVLLALARGRSFVRGLSDGDDNRRTLAALQALGVEVRLVEPGVFAIEGVGLHGLRAAPGTLDCGNSGTSLRLLAGLLCAQRFGSRLDGDRSLRTRPMRRLLVPLRAMGAAIEGARGPESDEVLPPLRIGPAPVGLAGIRYRSPIASAQVKSAVLLAGLTAKGATCFLEPARSRDHTERMLRAMGANLAAASSAEGEAVTLEPPGPGAGLRPLDLAVPGDLSSAAFLVGAALIVPGSEVRVRGVGVNPTRTGVLDALRAMGANLEVENAREVAGEPVADLVARASQLRAIRIDGALALRAIDEIPLLAALAACAEGETVIAGCGELRVKESDRIAAMAEALAALGIAVEERADGMAIQGGAARGGRVRSRGDHRIAMAAAVLALAARGESEIEDTANIATSFPGFASSLRALGARGLEQHGAEGGPADAGGPGSSS